MNDRMSGKRPLLEHGRHDRGVDRSYGGNNYQKPYGEDYGQAKRSRYDSGQYPMQGSSAGGALRPGSYQDDGYHRRDRSPGLDRSRETYVSRRNFQKYADCE